MSPRTFPRIGLGAQWLALLLACSALILIAVAFVDRPIADFSHAHFHLPHLLGHIARLPDALLAIAIFAPIAAVVAPRSRRSAQGLVQVALLCGLSLLWTACTTEFLLKRVFGRTGPAAWLNTGAYSFHLLGGRVEWLRDFPSGEAALVAAVLSVLWCLHPRWRAVYVLAFCTESLLLVVLTWHFVSDVLAGGFVGSSIGIAITTLWNRRENSLSNEP